MTAPVNTRGLLWGFSTLGCPELSFPQICALLSKFELHGLEVRAVDGRMDLPQWAVDAGWPSHRATAFLAKHDIQSNAIGPGYFATELTKPLMKNPKFNRWICDRTPAGRWGRPEELVGAAVFLASRASDFVNGQIIYVDGGLLASL